MLTPLPALLLPPLMILSKISIALLIKEPKHKLITLL